MSKKLKDKTKLIITEQKERKLWFFKDREIDIKIEDLQWSDEELKEMGL